MKKAAAKNNNARFEVSTVYGFDHSYEVVVLGHVLNGTIKKGHVAHVILERGTSISNWKIKDVLKIDFINDEDHTNFIGIVLACETVESYNLLRSLRVYEEILEIEKKEQTAEPADV